MRNGCIRRLDNFEPPSASDSSAMESIELDEMSLKLSGAFWKCRTITLPLERTLRVTTDLGQTISINVRTYKQIHTPTTVVQRGGGGGVNWTSNRRFWYVAVFWNDFTVSEKPLIFFTRWRIFYGWWSCWRPVTSPILVAILAAILEFTTKLEIRLKPQEMVIFCALHEKITHK